MITRPQVFTAIICVTIVALIAMWLGYSEVASGAGVGIVAIGLKILESKSN